MGNSLPAPQSLPECLPPITSLILDQLNKMSSPLFLILLLPNLVSSQQTRPHLRVGSVEAPPFLSSLGGDAYQGFIWDLLNHIAESQGFDFSIVLSDDSQYGVEEEPGNWTGLIGMVQREEIDVIAADLTQTWSRMSIVDFSKPFLATSLTLLLKDTGEPVPVWARWFAPFAPPLWILLLVALFATLLVLWLAVRLSPSERRSPASISDLLCRLLAPWIPSNHCWSPKAASSKCATTGWGVAHLILLILFVVHLPQHLSPRPAPRLSNVDEVLNESHQHAVLRGGSTQQLLMNSRNPSHKALWSSAVGIDTTSIGLETIAQGGTMVIEKATADHLTRQDCSLYTVGRLEDRHYAFAFPKGSRYRRIFSEGLLKITEQGKLSAAKLRWWPTSSCPSRIGASDQQTAVSPPIQLDLHQLAPLLLFLLGVLLLAILLLLVEVASPLAKQGKLSSLPSLVRRLLCSSSRWSEDSSNFFPTSNPSVATQTVLWSSSRAASPKPGYENRANLSHQLYSQDS